MKFHLVAVIPQADGATRYLMHTREKEAREMRAQIASDPTLIDCLRPRPNTCVMKYADGSLELTQWPALKIPWTAIKKIIGE